ncbi:MAG: hypothetical protein OHK0046_03780 [Anaerolineae bacterium]
MLEPLFNWLEGAGWLVLSGRPDMLSDVRAMALSRIQADGGIAYIGLDNDDYDDLIEDVGELGGPTGYLVNIMTEDDETIRTRLSEAGMIFIPQDYPPETLKSALVGAALEGVKTAYERGALVMGEGTSASLFGVKFMTEDGIATDGLNWLENAFVTSEDLTEDARVLLETRIANVAISIGEGAALVLGPEGQVERWGEDAVRIVLGLPPSEN